MNVGEFLLVLVAGLVAGAINAVVGSGSLVTFPTLLAIGIPPVTANVSNNVGILGGNFSAIHGYRPELATHRHRLKVLLPLGLGGGGLGALLLLILPNAAFEAIVPVLIGAACVLVLIQPWLVRRLRARQDRPDHPAGVAAAAAGTAIYGGYFGAAQGVLLLGLLGLLIDEDLQRINALKNLLATAANLAAAVVFVAATVIRWEASLAIAVGSTVGGRLGVTVGRRLPSWLYRVVIVLIGVVAIVKLLA